MFYEVRVFDPVGHLKNVIPSKTLSKRHWRNFEESENDLSFKKAKRGPVPKLLKQQIDAQFPV